MSTDSDIALAAAQAAAGSSTTASQAASAAALALSQTRALAGLDTADDAVALLVKPGVEGVKVKEALGSLATGPSALREGIEAAAGRALNGQVAPLVAEALADDDTPAQAAAAAVDGALDNAGLWHGYQDYTPLDEVVFSITDSENKESWLEIASDGGAPARVKGLIGEWAAANLPDGSVTREALDPSSGLPEAAPVGGGYSLAFIDANQRIGEIAMDDDGRIPNWVLEAISARMVALGYLNEPVPGGIPVANPPVLIAPSQVYSVAGALHKYRWQAIFEGWGADHKANVSVSGYTFTDSTEGVYADSLRYKPAAAGTRTATFRVRDRENNLILTETRSLITAPASTPTTLRHLAIGDSITRPNTYNKKAVDLLGGVTVGTRTYDNIASGEGRGGWQLSDYTGRFLHASYGDSPFLFPVGVAGDKYKGNVQWWSQVVSAEGETSYDHQGFQKIARGWNWTGPYLYDSTGYPVSPVAGDVVVDPSFASGSRYREYNGSAWVAMSPQPTGFEFSFPKYMQRFAAAYASGAPTCISFMLNTNDFYSGFSDAIFATWAANADTMINSIRAWSPTVPIIPIIAPLGGPQDNWARASGGHAAHEYNGRIKDAAQAMIAKWDTPEARTNKIFLCSLLGAIDDANMADNVHPNSAGLDQMAPPVAGAIAHAMGA